MKKIAFFFLFCFSISPLFAASFDCQKASTFVEKNICQSGELSLLDEKLSALYQQVLKNLNTEGTKQRQVQWLKERNNCQTESCLKKAYQTRIAELEGNSSNNLSLPPPGSLSGTYQTKEGNKLQLRETKSKIEFVLNAQWVGANPGQVNVGVACGEFTLKNNEALFTSTQAAEPHNTCKLHFKVKASQIEVEQLGDLSGCGFGLNVSATGLYLKKNSKVPTLTECLED